MPTEVTAFKANDGSLHEDRCAAAKKDIDLLISRSPLSENQPYARKVAEWLTIAPREIIDVLGEFLDACPNDSTDEAPSESDEGPVVTIPSGVCWSVEHDNFYHAGTNVGMGDEFYRQWVGRCLEFPQVDTEE